MNIEKRMYVRTDTGYIVKIIDVDINRLGVYQVDKIIERYNSKDKKCTFYDLFVQQNDILKASFNIIDLIEVGDYINGFKVFEYNEENKCFIVECYGMNCGSNWIYKSDDIKDIVTHEQFESDKYIMEV